MKISEIQSASTPELLLKLDAFEKEKMRLRFRKALSELKDTSRMKVVRKVVARIKFILSTRKQDNNKVTG